MLKVSKKEAVVVIAATTLAVSIVLLGIGSGHDVVDEINVYEVAGAAGCFVAAVIAIVALAIKRN